MSKLPCSVNTLSIFQSVIDGQKGAAAGRHADRAPGVDIVGERHTVATHRHDSPDIKGNVFYTHTHTVAHRPLY